MIVGDRRGRRRRPPDGTGERDAQVAGNAAEIDTSQHGKPLIVPAHRIPPRPDYPPNTEPACSHQPGPFEPRGFEVAAPVAHCERERSKRPRRCRASLTQVDELSPPDHRDGRALRLHARLRGRQRAVHDRTSPRHRAPLPRPGRRVSRPARSLISASWPHGSPVSWLPSPSSRPEPPDLARRGTDPGEHARVAARLASVAHLAPVLDETKREQPPLRGRHHAAEIVLRSSPGRLVRESEPRATSRVTCVSTGRPGRRNHTDRTTLPVLRPTPGSVTKSSRSTGSRRRTAPRRPAPSRSGSSPSTRKKPVDCTSSSSSSGRRPPSRPASDTARTPLASPC